MLLLLLLFVLVGDCYVWFGRIMMLHVADIIAVVYCVWLHDDELMLLLTVGYVCMMIT